MSKIGGYENIHRDLLDGLKSVYLTQAAKILDLPYNSAGEVEIASDVRLLIDKSSVIFLEFEFLAVLATIFVEQLIEEMPKYSL